ncbi:symmetrical bis(5'-nucleosyl)-tetraphosphatase [Acidiferrobacter sp.]|uniref:symmetrical bis(5'-nucleosyl)-tetraphosphatase n=1 Tax=Acidiferrobacter sp. TaxID=1872107 RepID=UPI002606E551|nr:symmetrical bis(5'-nucleosyl)-tetraphosphatase [Acidiferrobacter sp.]
MATYAIGDLQGCLRSLQALLAHIRYRDGTDRLWFTGDLVNRGPESLETLRFLRTLTDPVVVLGNHDLHLLGVACGARRVGTDDTLEAILTAPDRIELLDWLRQQPLLYHDTDQDIAMVHAGLPAQWTIAEARDLASELEGALQGPLPCQALEGIYGSQPDLWSPALLGADRLRFIANALTRIRYCDLEGRLDMRNKGPLGTQAPGLVPWFDVPGRRSRQTRIVFGHWSSLGRRVFGNVVCLDSGCLWGGTLTALRLEDSMFFSVPCDNCGA